MQLVEGCKTGFGEQILSGRESSSTAKFSKGGRCDKLSDEAFVQRNLGGTSKGATTEVKSGFGGQSASTNKNAPAFKMGEPRNDGTAQTIPGPGAYETTVHALGRQFDSAVASVQEITIGTETRFKVGPEKPGDLDPRPTSGWLGDAPEASFKGLARRSDVAKGLPGQTPSSLADPGPGAYHAKGSCLFEQTVSTKPTSHRVKVGSAPRDVSLDVKKKQYVSRRHETELLGAHSPGPHAYPVPNTTHSSRVVKSSSFGFGSGDRFSEHKSGNAKTLKVFSPGPGAYVT